MTIENNEWLWPNPGGFRVSVPRARADHEETKVLHGLARLLRKRGELGEAKVLVHISCIASTYRDYPARQRPGPAFFKSERGNQLLQKR